MPITEQQALGILKEELAKSSPPNLRWLELGIGDDCAILRSRFHRTVWTTDACIEGTHFLWPWLSPEDIAHKAWHAAISDVSAMGGRPRAVNVHLTLTPRVTGVFVRRFAAEQARLVASTGVAVVGGNVSFGSSFSAVTSVLGEVRGQPLRRDRAQPGDELWLCGEIGLARAGLLLLQSESKRRKTPSTERCLLAFRRPMAQLDKGVLLLGRAHCCIDLSDGLAHDSQQIALSSGVRVELDRVQLRACLSEDLVRTASLLGLDPLEIAMVGGEDYALLATGRRKSRPRWVRVIGQIVEC